MKKLITFLFLILALYSSSQDVLNMKPTGFVNDYEDLFTDIQEAYLDSIISDYEKKTSIEFAIVTIADFDFNFDTELFNKWKIGKQYVNNGLLLIISKKQRQISIKTGYGLEPLLPDAILLRIVNKIKYDTLSKELYFEGVKNIILSFINVIGTENYDFLIEKNKIEKQKAKQKLNEFLMNASYIFIAMIIIALIITSIIKIRRKYKAYLKLKYDINKLNNDIKNIKVKLYNFYDKEKIDFICKFLPSKIKYNTSVHKKLQYVYNELIILNNIVENINSYKEKIKNYKIEIETYLKNNYTYCNDYLKSELNTILPDLDNNMEYSQLSLNLITGLHTTIDKRLKKTLEKMSKIDKIVIDNNNIDSTINDLDLLYDKYITEIKILSNSKIGNRLNSIPSIEYDVYKKNIKKFINESFTNIKMNDFNMAINNYSNYFTTLTVVKNYFENTSILYDNFKKSNNNINKNNNTIDKLIENIKDKINKTGVNIQRKSELYKIEENIKKYKEAIGVDVILASNLLDTILKDINQNLNKINNDINNYNRYRSYNNEYSNTYRTNSSNTYNNTGGFGGFGGGMSGGGGIRTGF